MAAIRPAELVHGRSRIWPDRTFAAGCAEHPGRCRAPAPGSGTPVSRRSADQPLRAASSCRLVRAGPARMRGPRSSAVDRAAASSILDRGPGRAVAQGARCPGGLCTRAAAPGGPRTFLPTRLSRPPHAGRPWTSMVTRRSLHLRRRGLPGTVGPDRVTSRAASSATAHDSGRRSAGRLSPVARADHGGRGRPRDTGR